MSTKLIIIRGNSDSGKTTVAKAVRSRLGDGLSDNTLLVQQDTIRRDMLRERDMPDRRSVIELTELVVEFGRKQGRIVVLEGIFSEKKYGEMLRKMVGAFDEAYVYYFDLPFEETLKRHATKSNAHEFGEKEMREWWKEKDYLNLPNEKILHERVGIDEVVDKITQDIGLGGKTLVL
jgi:adenylate kinase family enzyme